MNSSCPYFTYNRNFPKTRGIKIIRNHTTMGS